MIIYFSGTGNSRYCAQMLADKLEEELFDSFYHIKNGIAAELVSGTPWVFVLPVVMPENYIAMFEVPQPELAKRIVLVAKRSLLKVVRTVRKGESFPEPKVNLADKFKSGPLNPIFYKLFVKAKPFHTTDACVSCGKCEKVCVLNNISIKDGKPVWGDACTHCMACICGCPTEAIEYGKRSQGKPRYQCEEYKK